MKKNPVIAIVGATGLVGGEIVVALEDLHVPHESVRLIASQESAGEVYKIGGEEAVVEVLGSKSFSGVDLAVFATNSELSGKYIPAACEAGAVCIDGSGRYASQPEVPLIVPGVNLESLAAEHPIIASACSPASQMLPVLSVVHREAGLKRVVVSTYESVSGAGKDALDELWGQTLAIFNQKEIQTEAFEHQIAFNCIPQIDVVNEEGDTRSELRIVRECSRILGLPGLKMSVTAVRVPVLYSHAESINVETERRLEPLRLRELLAATAGIAVYPAATDYPMHLTSVGTDEIHVGRIRRDGTVENGLNMWVVADNVRRGAAVNTVQIIKYMIEKFAG